MGFEPTEAFTSHAFQACRFGRSRTLPSGCIATTTGGQANWLVRSSHQFPRVSVGGEVAVGSCATIARKPGQVLTEAASTRDRSCAAGRLAVTSLPIGAHRGPQRVSDESSGRFKILRCSQLIDSAPHELSQPLSSQLASSPFPTPSRVPLGQARPHSQTPQGHTSTRKSLGFVPAVSMRPSRPHCQVSM